MRSLLVATVIVLPSVVACAELPCEPVEHDAELQIGIEDGSDATMEIGPQGGFHIYVPGRSAGVCAAHATMDFEVALVDTAEVVASGTVPIGMSDDDDEWRMLEPDPTIALCPPPAGLDVLDREATVRVHVYDDAGRAAVDERRVVLRCPTDHPNVLNTCRRVCDRHED